MDVFPGRIVTDPSSFLKLRVPNTKTEKESLLQNCVAFECFMSKENNRVRYCIKGREFKICRNFEYTLKLNERASNYASLEKSYKKNNWFQLQTRYTKHVNEGNEYVRDLKNGSVTLGFRWGNLFLVKSMFTFGLRTVGEEEYHVVQTKKIGLFYYEMRRGHLSDRQFDHCVKSWFRGYIVPPDSCFRISSGKRYVLITYAVTVFLLERVRNDVELEGMDWIEVLKPVESSDPTVLFKKPLLPPSKPGTSSSKPSTSSSKPGPSSSKPSTSSSKHSSSSKPSNSNSLKHSSTKTSSSISSSKHSSTKPSSSISSSKHSSTKPSSSISIDSSKHSSSSKPSTSSISSSKYSPSPKHSSASSSSSSKHSSASSSSSSKHSSSSSNGSSSKHSSTSRNGSSSKHSSSSSNGSSSSSNGSSSKHHNSSSSSSSSISSSSKRGSSKHSSHRSSNDLSFLHSRESVPPLDNFVQWSSRYVEPPTPKRPRMEEEDQIPKILPDVEMVNPHVFDPFLTPSFSITHPITGEQFYWQVTRLVALDTTTTTTANNTCLDFDNEDLGFSQDGRLKEEMESIFNSAQNAFAADATTIEPSSTGPPTIQNEIENAPTIQNDDPPTIQNDDPPTIQNETEQNLIPELNSSSEQQLEEFLSSIQSEQLLYNVDDDFISELYSIPSSYPTDLQEEVIDLNNPEFNY